LVDAQRGFDDLYVVVYAAAEGNERFGVLWKATAAEPWPGMQELGSDTSIHSHPLGDIVDIGSQQFTQSGNLVDKRYLCRQERVRSVLDHLRRFRRCDDKRSLDQIERTVKIFQYSCGFVI